MTGILSDNLTGYHLSNYPGDDYYTIVTEAKNNSFMADSNLPNDKRKLFSIERKGSLIDAVGGESPNIKFYTSEYLKQASISTWDLTLIGSYFNNMNTFIPARFTININVETCFDAMLYFDRLTPNIDKVGTELLSSLWRQPRPLDIKFTIKISIFNV